MHGARTAGSFHLEGVEYVVLAESVDDARQDHPRSLDMLTQRELQVAAMVCEGHGNKRIADRLHLSEWTVSSYLRRIYGKLGVHTRAAMVARVVAELRPPEPHRES